MWVHIGNHLMGYSACSVTCPPTGCVTVMSRWSAGFRPPPKSTVELAASPGMTHQRGTSFARRGAAVLGAAVLAVALMPPQQAAAAPVSTTAPPGDGRSHTVPLITGDRVRVCADGVVTFLPGAGRENVRHRVVMTKDGTIVLPGDAEALVASGVAERRLFDVTRLIEDGFADRESLPLIVAGGADTALTAGGTGLESIGATATTPADPGGWWKDLSASRRAKPVGHIWLDGNATPSLDRSVPQVGAPAAWAAGFDGSGVTVAILDTGYDASHPDLAGRVAKARDFTGTSPEAADGYGHGTHVASILAGTGAASGGTYKGVAPGASLLIGKVCTDQGRCPASAIIEGMEWAAGEGASAISMSLGFPVWGDQPDPVALAVEALSESSGTLVVAAAGNDGSDASVESPAIADAALAVASVTKDDEYSDFSSRGPRASDRAAKPDIAAPGSDITAAHAAGTPGDGPYATHSGTSMSTPHVTGAVALLKQRHPDWTGTRLKAALMSTAKVLDGQTAYQQGAGRLDVARAIAQDVTGDGSVSFPLTNFPAPAEPVVKTVTYTNDGTTDVTLNLATSGPDGLFVVDAPSVTVPAKGTATVNVSLHPGAFPGAGDFPGGLTATADGISAHTVLTASMEREAYSLTLSGAARPGEQVDDMPMLGWNPDTDTTVWFSPTADGTWNARVPQGRYIVVGAIQSSAPDEDLPRLNFASRDVTVTGATTVTFDLATGVEVAVDALDRDDETPSGMESLASVGIGDTGINTMVAGNYRRYFTLPSPAPAGLETWWALGTTLTAPGAHYELTTSSQWIPATLDLAYTDAELARVDETYQTQAGPSGTALRSEVMRTDGFPMTTGHRTVTLPSAETGFYVPGTWLSYMDAYPDDSGRTREFEYTERALSPGSATSNRWNASPVGARFQRQPFRYAQFAFMFDMSLFSGPGNLRTPRDEEITTTVTLDGKPLEVDSQGTYFEAPDGAAGRFGVTFDGVRDVPYSTIGTRSTVSWTFDSAPAADEDLPVRAFGVNATGVRDGYAAARLPQLVTLAEQTPDTGKPALKTLILEVSHDDGKTWTKVPVIRAGDSSFAVLTHPSGATSVSTRVSSVDADGNTSAQTMIRSWALR